VTYSNAYAQAFQDGRRCGLHPDGPAKFWQVIDDRKCAWVCEDWYGLIVDMGWLRGFAETFGTPDASS